ncbi:response regulator [Actinoplanes couchii]|uniref:Response regulatory domain-containing protein n=1 Tax=Actinoplanes couchii TaxID=403638 RepID=A0ABQ3XML5_9ACTN|nr:response regulator [Actinoplanes couchii]MDR6321610.1 CheY-like chemotaxis protein [Actinoplanes couchii]GID59705.1 hypothetical protein Aco03nite_081090 [Actinoplanes couchii]
MPLTGYRPWSVKALLRTGVTLALLGVVAVGSLGVLRNGVTLRQEAAVRESVATLDRIGAVQALSDVALFRAGAAGLDPAYRLNPAGDVATLRKALARVREREQVRLDRRLGDLRGEARTTRWLIGWATVAVGLIVLTGALRLRRRLTPATGTPPPSPSSGVSPPSAASSSPAPHTRSLLVLVAEDDPVDQRLDRRLLERLGHQVVTVGDGEAAVEAVLRDRFDLVLMGSGLLVLDGPAAVRLIHADPPSRGLPRIVAVCSDAGEHEEFVTAKVDGVLARPLDAGELEVMLARSAAFRDVRAAAPDIRTSDDPDGSASDGPAGGAGDGLVSGRRAGNG